MIKKKSMAAMSVLALLASIGSASAATAAPVAEDPVVTCFSEYANNDRAWQEHRTDLRGLANWHESGDKLTVIDDPGYMSTAARLEVCVDYKWVYKGYYTDSWVNGSKTYDFDFQEKRRVRFYVCKKEDVGVYTHCGEWKYGNA